MLVTYLLQFMFAVIGVQLFKVKFVFSISEFPIESYEVQQMNEHALSLSLYLFSKNQNENQYSYSSRSILMCFFPIIVSNLQALSFLVYQCIICIWLVSCQIVLIVTHTFFYIASIQTKIVWIIADYILLKIVEAIYPLFMQLKFYQNISIELFIERE